MINMNNNNRYESVSFAVPAFTATIKIIVIINAAIFLTENILNNLNISSYLVWSFDSIINKYEIWRLLTYSFVHLNFPDLILNMLILWMFGSELENKWGVNFFIKYYLASVIGAGLLSLPFAIGNPMPLWGANSVILSLLTAYAVSAPNKIVYFMLFFPMKVKWLIALIACVDIFMIKPETGSSLIYLLHLNGIAAGFIYLKYSIVIDAVNNKFRRRNIFIDNLKYLKNSGYRKNYDKINVYSFNDSKNPIDSRKYVKTENKPDIIDLDKKIDEVLDKMKNGGMESLNYEEKMFLKRASHLLKNKYSGNPVKE